MSCPVTVNECDDDALALNRERSSPLVTVTSAGSKKKFDMTTSATGSSEGDELDGPFRDRDRDNFCGLEVIIEIAAEFEETETGPVDRILSSDIEKRV